MNDVMEEVGSISREVYDAKKKEDAEEKLVPAGTWEGQVFSWNLVEETDRTPNDLRGKRLYSVGIRFFDCPEYGKSKSGFFKVTPDELLTETGKKQGKYKAAIDFVGALDMFDQPFTEVLEQAKVTRLKYRIMHFTPEDKDVTYNILKEVKAL